MVASSVLEHFGELSENVRVVFVGNGRTVEGKPAVTKLLSEVDSSVSSKDVVSECRGNGIAMSEMVLTLRPPASWMSEPLHETNRFSMVTIAHYAQNKVSECRFYFTQLPNVADQPERKQPEHFRPSSRVIQPSGGYTNNIFNAEPLPLKTGRKTFSQPTTMFSAPVNEQHDKKHFGSEAGRETHSHSSIMLHTDPTKEIHGKKHFNFEPTSVVPEHPAMRRRDPNWSSSSDSLDQFEKMDLSHKKSDSNLFKSQIDIAAAGSAAPVEMRPNKKLGQSDQYKSHFSIGESNSAAEPNDSNVHMKKAVRDHNAASEEFRPRPSSRVLGPPGGLTTIRIG